MNPIDGKRWKELSAYLEALLDADPAEREVRLDEIERDDARLAADLRSLLAEQSAAASKGFLEGGAELPLQDGIAGQSVGPYTLDRVLGEGGMGAVWLAHRNDGRFEGQVAIKFLSLPSTGPAGRQRFEREGHVLARLRHPNIAHLLDAGVTAGGQPYLVLEYIEGEPLDVWCRNRGLSTANRIELFLQVLAAVSHAHGKLILHRDLKPSNILVAADGQVKLLDFGIAKLLDDEAPERIRDMTQQAGRAFTLDYAAPEQLLGDEVTTATDVYALGVLLYVLLTGQHPTAADTTTPAQRMRAVLDTEPRPPSSANARAQSAGVVSASAATRVPKGDLDNIVTKALRKLPAERYATADALAEDLKRYLRNEPVSARPDAAGYRLRKFVARHTLPVVAAAVVVMSISVAAFVSLWQAREATTQRDRALTLAARNAAVLDFVAGMLTEVVTDDQPVRGAELLDRSQALLLASHTNAEQQAAILDLLAEYHLSAGSPTNAQPLLERALQLVIDSDDTALRATILCNLGHAASLANRREAALESLRRGIDLARAEPLAAAKCLQKRAYLAQNFNDAHGALRFAREAQEQLRRSGVAKPDQEASLLGDIAYAHYLSGDTAEADRHYEEALTRYAALGRADSPATFSLRNNWGIASFAAGDNQRALENYEEALAIARRRSPQNDPPVYLMSNRALALASLARYPEAIRAFDEAVAASERQHAIASITHARVNRAGTYLSMGDVARCEQELAIIEREYAHVIPPDSVPAVTIRFIRGRLAMARGDLAEAKRQLDATITFFDERNMAVAPVSRALNERAQLHRRLGDMVAAAADAARSLEISRALQGARGQSSLTGLALLQMAELQASSGDAAAAHESAREAALHLMATLGDAHPDTIRARQLSG